MLQRHLRGVHRPRSLRTKIILIILILYYYDGVSCWNACLLFYYYYACGNVLMQRVMALSLNGFIIITRCLFIFRNKYTYIQYFSWCSRVGITRLSVSCEICAVRFDKIYKMYKYAIFFFWPSNLRDVAHFGRHVMPNGSRITMVMGGEGLIGWSTTPLQFDYVFIL